MPYTTDGHWFGPWCADLARAASGRSVRWAWPLCEVRA